MSGIVYDFPKPLRFVAGAVGLPGDRTFFLQAQSATQLSTVTVEKEQLVTLTERLQELLELVKNNPETHVEIPEEPLERLVDNAGLVTPIDSEFKVGTMGIAWNSSLGCVIIECYELTVEEMNSGATAEPAEDGEDERQRLRVRLDPAQAKEFIRRADQVVNAGRQDCPYCFQPIEPDGHICVRLNGIPR